MRCCMPRLPLPRERRRQFWLLVRAGRSWIEAAGELESGAPTANRWFVQAGGVVPAHVRDQPSGRHLSVEEREKILVGISRGDSIRQIARDLGRATSTVTRELAPHSRQRR